MSDTLKNIIIPKNTWVDIYQESGIQRGSVIAVYNAGSSDIKLSTSNEEPDEDSENFQYLRIGGLPMKNDGNSYNEWAYSQNKDGKISVKVIS